MLLRNGTCEEAGLNPAKLKYVEDFIKESVDTGIKQAFAFLIARNGIIVSHKAFGKQSYKKDSKPLEVDVIFPMSSITKPVTATAAMILHDERKLDIDAPVSSYVPEFKGKGKEKVLIHHLMTHSSGIRDEDIWEYRSKKSSDIKLPPAQENQHPVIHKELFYGYEVSLRMAPGEEMSYCSYGVELLGDIIRRVSGQSYESFVRERIFTPLGMDSSFLIVPENVRNRLVIIPDSFGGYNNPVFLESPFAAYGLFSTVYDMSVFAQMFLNRGAYGNIRILSEESVREMTRNQIPGVSANFFDEHFDEATWGYCWDIPAGKGKLGELLSPHAIAHEGGGDMLLVIDPQYNLIIAGFTVSWVKPLPGKESRLARKEQYIPDLVIKAIE